MTTKLRPLLLTSPAALSFRSASRTSVRLTDVAWATASSTSRVPGCKSLEDDHLPNEIEEIIGQQRITGYNELFSNISFLASSPGCVNCPA